MEVLDKNIIWKCGMYSSLVDEISKMTLMVLLLKITNFSCMAMVSL